MTLGNGLKASAGSGKTFNLSSRFIAIFLRSKFEKKSNLSQILALTFTKKAATEMKNKITQTFFDLQNKDELKLICDLTNLDKATILRLRDESEEEFLNADLKISTYDSFFNMILRIFALNAGINPNFEITNIQKDAEKKFIKKFSTNKNLQEFLVDYLLSDENNSLKSLIENLKTFSLNSSDFSFSGAKFPSDLNIKNTLETMQQIAIDSDMNQKAIKAFKFEKPKEILKKAISGYEILGDQRDFKKNFNPILEKLYLDFKIEMKDYFDELQNYEFDKFSKVLSDFNEIKIELNKEKNCLDFSDVTNFVSKILCDKNLDKDFLYFRLDDKINHILLDEFQDTNVMQYKILYPLIDEILAGFGQKDLGSFFYVGDTKQSIYRFRNSKKELFDKLKKDFKDKIEIKTLDVNYRSCKLLVDFVNEKFCDKYSDFTKQKANNKNDGYIKVFNPQKILKDEKIDVYQSIAEAIFQEIKYLQNFGVENSEICILCWKNKDIDYIQNFLNDKGIKTSSQGAKTLFEVPKIRGLIEFLRFCVTGEELYLLNAKKLLCFENLETFKINLNKSVSQTIIFAAQKIGLNLVDKDILDLISFANKSNNLINFLFEENEEKSATNDDFGVKIMTTHNSKGLEFEHLIVCDKLSNKKSDNQKILVEFDTEKNTWDKFLRINQREKIDKNYANFIDKIQKFDNEEELNKIYVALTRAKTSLIIIKNPDETKDSYFNYKITSKDEKEPILFLQDCVLPKFWDNFDDDRKKFILTQNQKKQDKKLSKISKEIILAKGQKQDILKVDEILDYKSAIFGTTLHYVLEMMSDFNEISLQNSIKKAKNLYAKMLSNDEFDEIEKRIKLLLQDEKFKDILYEGEIYKEQSFKINNQIKRLDLFVLKKDSAFILDYKTGNFNEKNKEQVLFYKDCIRKFYPQKQIFAFLIYLNCEISFVEV